MNPAFRNWLARNRKPSTVSSCHTRCKTVEDQYGDLDSLYEVDGLTGVLEALQYSKDAEDGDLPNPSKVNIDGNLRKGLASYKAAIKLYCEFRAALNGPFDTDAWDRFLRDAKRRLEDGTLDQDEGYKADLAAAVSVARTAVLADADNWQQLLKDAVKDGRNNLVDWRDQAKLVRWIDEGADRAGWTLRQMWGEGDASDGARIRAFDDNLPTELFGRRAKSTRLDCGSYLMMGLDASRCPPIRLTRFQKTYERLGYPESQAEDLGGEYEYALQFLDEVIAQAKAREMDRPRTRLDAQSVVWSLSYPSSSDEGVAESEVGQSESATTDDGTRRELNTILYGPPGTGKTYAIVRRSVEICDGTAPEAVEELRARYGALMDEGRIEFVTFHQSYGYEEFVEGLRPVTADSGGMRLEVKAGVLKRIAEKARKLPEIGGRRIFKMSLGDPKCWGRTSHDNAIFAECIANDYVLLEFGGDIDWSDSRYDKWDGIWERWREDRNPDATVHDTDIQAMWRFRTDMKPGDIVVVSDGYRHFRAVGEIAGDYKFERREDGFHHQRTVRWHWHVLEREGDPVSVFKAGAFQWRPVNQMKPANPAGLAPYLSGVGEIGRARPHVLVIDEINRANISKVMGELITLLEEDKREGSENEIAVTLPYSGDRFTLPDNLHILGTMNTADRSIALLDTALRRRFRFEEMSPDPDLLTDAADRTGVNLPRVLQAMNERLEYLVDRDHLIGHAWFIDTAKREDVDGVMRHKIIPLIAEYFYDDWNKVLAVLGGTDDFVKRQRLNAPPGLGSDAVEDRYRWTVREAFADDAYEKLVNPAGRNDNAE